MKMLRITLEGRSYDVGVEVLEETSSAATTISHAAPVPAQTLSAATAATLNVPVSVPGCTHVASPMAGQVFKCPVKTGDVVAVNQVVIVLDAMKMETPVCAPIAGTVRAVLVKEGDAVDEGHILVQIEG